MAGEYTIVGGLADAQRLARQAHVMAEASEAFVSGLGLAPDWSCLDVGCGDGQVTIAMARMAGPAGRVVGVDVDAEALELAREAGRRAGVNASSSTRTPPDRSRAAPSTSPIPGSCSAISLTLRPRCARWWRRCAPGGRWPSRICSSGHCVASRRAPALDRLQEVYSATVRFHGGDPTIGPRLCALLRASGLTEVRERTVANPMTTVDDKLFLAQLVPNMRAAILEAGVATDDEIDDLEARVEQAARDPANVFYQARSHQVSGRRAA